MRRQVNRILLASFASIVMGARWESAQAAATAKDLEDESHRTLATLIQTHPAAEALSRKARATIVFPNIVKAGLVFGGAYGEGVLMQEGKVTAYLNSVTATWGLQAGAQSYAYVMFLVSERALRHFERTRGWEIGVGPTVVVVNEGAARNLSTETLKGDVYAFITDQHGLMASLSIEGTKISRIKRV